MEKLVDILCAPLTRAVLAELANSSSSAVETAAHMSRHGQSLPDRAGGNRKSTTRDMSILVV